MKLSDFDCVIWNKNDGVYEHPSEVIRILQRKYSGEDVTEYEIELFTGVYDKNGKKIYENDIIKASNESVKTTAIVVMDNDRSYSICDENLVHIGKLHSMDKQGYTLEIIGDIHQIKS